MLVMMNPCETNVPAITLPKSYATLSTWIFPAAAPITPRLITPSNTASITFFMSFLLVQTRLANESRY